LQNTIYSFRLKCTFSHAEKALFGKFEGQKMAFRSENTGANPHSENGKSQSEDCGNVITDFKTAATSTLCELSHELQLTAYACLFREATGQEELRCEIRQLIKTKTPKIMTHRFPRRTDEHFARFFGLIREYVDVLDKGIYNYRPSWTCGTMCEHHSACAI
jgi:hypothetical protein